MTINNRFIYLFTSIIPVCIIYILTGGISENVWIVPNSFVEDLIPFNSFGIWLYLFFYIYIPYTFITANESKINILTASFLTSSFISGAIFVIFPSSINFISFEVDGISSYLLNIVSKYDTPQNCFPSLHAVLISLCTLANWDKTRKVKCFVLFLLTILMYYSIIQVRRHVFIDLFAGILIALITWIICKKTLDLFKIKQK